MLRTILLAVCLCATARDASGALHLDVVGPHWGIGPADGLVVVTQMVGSTGSSIVLGDASVLVLPGS